MTRARPRVSVGMPVYNGERYLAAALESLRAQTYEDFELIISDNASIDRTAEIARSYAAQDRRIRYVRNAKNLGAAANFRHTVQLASGEYFRWAAADDISAPEFLARCIEVLDRESEVVLAYPKTRFIDEHGRVTSDYDDRLHLLQQRASDRFRALIDRLGHCNAMYGLMRTDVVRRTRLLGSYFGADIVLLAELVLYGAFWEVPEFLFYRRFHEAAHSRMTTIDQWKAFWNPEDRGRIYFYAWRHLWEHARSLPRAPLDAAEKLRVATLLVRMALWRRRRLSQEITDAARQLVGEVSRQAAGS
ncbi:MAG: glycosyltransferase family 2 protein [Chloroflexi bacterium]|nr:MAG: glycosyltransferase family 2 protein [Chloroflexota bacterium]